MSAMSLKAAAVNTMIMNAFNSDPSELDWIEDTANDATNFADLLTAIKDKFVEQPSVISLSAGATLFDRYIIKDSTFIDLTPYKTISGSEVCILMEHLATKKQTYNVILPDIDSLKLEELKRLVNTGAIISLHLGQTPRIKLAFVVRLVSSPAIQALTHPSLYSRPFDLTFAKEFASPESSWSNAFRCGDGTSFPLRQIVYVTTLDSTNANTHRLRSSGIKWSQFANSQRDSGAFFVALPMEDTLMAPDRLMKFVSMALGRLAGARGLSVSSAFGMSNVAVGIAKQAAVDADQFVSCVPGMMLATWMKVGTSSGEKRPKAQFVVSGEWTLVFCHERQLQAANGGYVIRYAFASMTADKKSIVLSAEDFFAKCIKGNDIAMKKLALEWREQMAGISLCSAEEVFEAPTFTLGIQA